MPARVHYSSGDEARRQLGDPRATAADRVADAVRSTIDALAARLPDSSVVHIARDGARDCRATIVDDRGDYPLGNAFVLGEAGEIAILGLGEPVYHETLDAMAIVAQATAVASVPHPTLDTGGLRCPTCEELVAVGEDATIRHARSRYERHHGSAHGPVRWGIELPAEIVAALHDAGVVTTSGQRAYREARHDGAGHHEALAAAMSLAEAEAETMGLGDEGEAA